MHSKQIFNFTQNFLKSKAEFSWPEVSNKQQNLFDFKM